MPVMKDQYTPPDVSRYAALQERLAAELRNPRPFGQPLVREETFSRSGLIGVTVVWDAWEPRDAVQRSTIILNAYEEVYGKEYKDRIGFAIGFTEPEAVDAGLLPYEVKPILRKSDPPDLTTRCREAMLELGASDLWRSDEPRLRLPSSEQAAQYVSELVRRVEGSEGVWVSVLPYPLLL